MPVTERNQIFRWHISRKRESDGKYSDKKPIKIPTKTGSDIQLSVKVKVFGHLREEGGEVIHLQMVQKKDGESPFDEGQTTNEDRLTGEIEIAVPARWRRLRIPGVRRHITATPRQ